MHASRSAGVVIVAKRSQRSCVGRSIDPFVLSPDTGAWGSRNKIVSFFNDFLSPEGPSFPREQARLRARSLLAQLEPLAAVSLCPSSCALQHTLVLCALLQRLHLGLALQQVWQGPYSLCVKHRSESVSQILWLQEPHCHNQGQRLGLPSGSPRLVFTTWVCYIITSTSQANEESKSTILTLLPSRFSDEIHTFLQSLCSFLSCRKFRVAWSPGTVTML